MHPCPSGFESVDSVTVIINYTLHIDYVQESVSSHFHNKYPAELFFSPSHTLSEGFQIIYTSNQCCSHFKRKILYKIY